MENDWLVTIFKCDSSKAKKILVDLYDFMNDVEGVEDQHFLIRDRIENEIIFSFRILGKEKDRRVIASKIKYKLGNLISEENFVVEPTPDHQMYKYGAWPWRNTLEERGNEKFNAFCSFLSRLSALVIEMAKQDYFSSSERFEMAHVFSWMLGCTEELRLLPFKTMNSIMVGYFDRIENKYHTLSRGDFPKKVD
jgi:hypothetical protein